MLRAREQVAVSEVFFWQLLGGGQLRGSEKVCEGLRGSAGRGCRYRTQFGRHRPHPIVTPARRPPPVKGGASVPARVFSFPPRHCARPALAFPPPSDSVCAASGVAALGVAAVDVAASGVAASGVAASGVAAVDVAASDVAASDVAASDVAAGGGTNVDAGR